MIAFFGDHVTRSLEISTQTFSDGKILEIKSFDSTMAISAAVASLPADNLPAALGHLGLQQIFVCVSVHMLHPSSDSGGSRKAFKIP